MDRTEAGTCSKLTAGVWRFRPEPPKVSWGWACRLALLSACGLSLTEPVYVPVSIREWEVGERGEPNNNNSNNSDVYQILWQCLVLVPQHLFLQSNAVLYKTV